MDARTLQALVEAGAVRRVRIVADGAIFHVVAETGGGKVTASTRRGGIRTWRSLDAAAGWVHRLGIGALEVDLGRWQPGQRQLAI
jgi:hypothetical protein